MPRTVNFVWRHLECKRYQVGVFGNSAAIAALPGSVGAQLPRFLHSIPHEHDTHVKPDRVEVMTKGWRCSTLWERAPLARPTSGTLRVLDLL